MTLGEAAAWLQTHSEMNSTDDESTRGSSIGGSGGQTLNSQKAYKFSQKLKKQGLP